MRSIIRLATTILMLMTTSAACAGALVLHVDAGDDQGRILQPHVYDAGGCHGEDISPAMTWAHVPSGTRSIAVTVFDPDAGNGWRHWAVVDMAPGMRHLSEGGPVPPHATVLDNSFGHTRWDGPCPPAGDAPHHYVFTVYALNVPALDVSQNVSIRALQQTLARFAIDTARVTLTYGR